MGPKVEMWIPLLAWMSILPVAIGKKSACYWFTECARQYCLKTRSTFNNWIGDGICQRPCNILKFEYDGGDCCAHSCRSILCGSAGYNCLNITQSFKKVQSGTFNQARIHLSSANDAMSGSGGDTTYDVDHRRIHQWVVTGTTKQFTAESTGCIEVLLVAGGGGGGGKVGGGGGAGGLVYTDSYFVQKDSVYNVVVGAGGAGGSGLVSGGGTNIGSDGSDSSFGDLVAIGGGGGASSGAHTGRLGGSGGGGRFGGGSQSSTATIGQGHAGGLSDTHNSGGGGGAGGNGIGGSAGSGIGDGGPGSSYSISGSLVTYAGGGGGAGSSSGLGEGIGGSGGGGNGGTSSSADGSNGVDQRGGGGGGGYSASDQTDGGAGGTGGSGIVFVSYTFEPAAVPTAMPTPPPADTFITATGGAFTIDDGSYRVHVFQSSGTFEVTSQAGHMEILLVAGGGGGGGRGGGGGGAGGLVHVVDYFVQTGSHTVVVGAGGSGGCGDPTISSCNALGSTGGDSGFGQLVAKGGGGGASDGNHVGLTGGSSGGGRWNSGSSNSVLDQGNKGGHSTYVPSGFSTNNFGGGGGAGGVGADGDDVSGMGDGGPGSTISITGQSVTYACGGGGGGAFPTSGHGAGGSPCGGDGGNDDIFPNPGNDGSNGDDFTGGGGGGGWVSGLLAETGGAGGNGGSGVVIVRYLRISLSPSTAPTTLHPTSANPSTSPTSASPSTTPSESPTTKTPTISPTTGLPITTTPTVTTQTPSSSPTSLNPTSSSPVSLNPTSKSPVSLNPTSNSPFSLNPTTRTPSVTPSVSPTVPTNHPSSRNPITASPSSSPKSQNPTSSSPSTTTPTTVSPVTGSPTTASPSTTNPTAIPTVTPVTASPTFTTNPSTNPTVTTHPTTAGPTANPITASPITTSPSSNPTVTPVTASPATTTPTGIPTAMPITANPTATPITGSPITTGPTATPVTGRPTTSTPTGTPITAVPTTNTPVAVSPTLGPIPQSLASSSELEVTGRMVFETIDCSESVNARNELQSNIALEFRINANLVSVLATCSSVMLDYNIRLLETDFGTENGNDMYTWQTVLSTVKSLSEGNVLGSSLFNMSVNYGSVTGESVEFQIVQTEDSPESVDDSASALQPVIIVSCVVGLSALILVVDYLGKRQFCKNKCKNTTPIVMSLKDFFVKRCCSKKHNAPSPANNSRVRSVGDSPYTSPRYTMDGSNALSGLSQSHRSGIHEERKYEASSRRIGSEHVSRFDSRFDSVHANEEDKRRSRRLSSRTPKLSKHWNKEEYRKIKLLVGNENNPLAGVMRYNESEVEKVKKLGEGNFGYAYLVNIRRHSDASSRLAVLKEPKNAHGWDEQTAKELRAMAALKRHPNVVQFLGAVAMETKKICFLTAYYERGSLDVLHEKEDMASKDRFIRVAKDVCEGLAYLHSDNIIHRDLACRNLLMDEDGRVVICDFGLSRVVEEKHQCQGDVNGRVEYHADEKGKIAWRWTSPESCKSRKFTKESDIWSLGVTFWEILTKGKEPYEGRSYKWIITRLLDIKTWDDTRLKSPPPSLFEDILRSCFAIKPEDRPSIDSILEQLKIIKNSDDKKRVSIVAVRNRLYSM